jgi:hypothetical protein
MEVRDFEIVARPKNWSPRQREIHQDRYGYVVIDDCPRMTYQEAQNLLAEYRLAMPSHTVLIRILSFREDSYE